MKYISNGTSIEPTNGIANELAYGNDEQASQDHAQARTAGAGTAPSSFWRDKTRRLIAGASVAALSGTLVFSGLPAAAIAQTVTASQSSSSSSSSSSNSSSNAAGSSSDAPGEPPSGGAGPGGQGGSSDSGTPGEPPSDASGPGGQGGGGANTTTFDYSGTYSGTLTADGETVTSDGEAVDSSEADKNAALAQNAGTLNITNGTLTKSGDDTDGDNCNFYGLNSILLSVGEGSLATVKDTTLSATSEGSNAIFATDSGTVYADGVTTNTSAGNSRGLDATYGGAIIANDVTATTEGDHCATVATDRGGGSISLTNSELYTAGSGSPLLYSTGDIEVSGVTGTATGSQIAGMEGLNTILINNSTLESTQADKTASDPVADGIIIYQSTSGDAETTTGETATFQAANSTLKSAITSGSMFYLTNTSADVVLSNTTLDFDSSAADLILAAGNDSNNWGSAGSNGATVKFTAIDQTLSGNVEADTISSVDLHLTSGSTWTGAGVITANASAADGSKTDAPVTVNVDGTSTWVVTESCTISALNVAEGASVVDENGKTVTVVANGQTMVQGDSDITVTCDSYSTSYDSSEASTLAEDLIDRTAFDEQMGTSTTWTMGDATSTASATTATTSSSSAASDSSSEAADSLSSNPIIAFFGWLASLVGL